MIKPHSVLFLYYIITRLTKRWLFTFRCLFSWITSCVFSSIFLERFFDFIFRKIYLRLWIEIFCSRNVHTNICLKTSTWYEIVYILLNYSSYSVVNTVCVIKASRLLKLPMTFLRERPLFTIRHPYKCQHLFTLTQNMSGKC